MRFFSTIYLHVTAISWPYRSWASASATASCNICPRTNLEGTTSSLLTSWKFQSPGGDSRAGVVSYLSPQLDRPALPGSALSPWGQGSTSDPAEPGSREAAPASAPLFPACGPRGAPPGDPTTTTCTSTTVTSDWLCPLPGSPFLPSSSQLHVTTAMEQTGLPRLRGWTKFCPRSLGSTEKGRKCSFNGPFEEEE